MNVLLSIKPKYANAILSGEKEYEFRRSIFRREGIDRLYIYSTSPVNRIVGVFKVDNIIEDHPKRLWEICQNKSGIEEEEFFNYFNGCEKGYAIKIKDLEPLEDPIDPRSLSSDFIPPQSFCYFNISPIRGR